MYGYNFRLLNFLVTEYFSRWWDLAKFATRKAASRLHTAGIDILAIKCQLLFYHHAKLQSAIDVFLMLIWVILITSNKVLQVYLLCSKCSEECSSELVVHNILYTMLFTVNTVNL